MSLTEKLAGGGFLSLVELDPPKGADPAGFIARAKAAAKLADGLVVSDLSDAVMRMSALGGALILHKEGLVPICSVSPAHKNRLALQAELLAASALGLEDVLVVRGEEPKAGDHHEAQPLNDLTLQQVLECLDALAQSRDFAGHALEGAAQFSVGCAIDLWTPGRMDGPKTEIARRASAGAEYFVTPPIFDLEHILAFKERLGADPPKIIPQVLILKSVAMAQAIRLHARQVHMPDGLVSRLKKAKNPQAECLALARELAGGIREAGFAGVLIAAHGWEDGLPSVLA